MPERVRVFLSHSFHEEDRQFVDWFKAFLKKPRFHFDIQTAEYWKPKQFGRKIEEMVEWADITLGLFTRRSQDTATGTWLPPPYVISECSYALGRNRDLEFKGVHGFVEAGIEHKSLGLATARGEEFPSFDRKDWMTGNTAKLEGFMAELLARYAKSSIKKPVPPYRQKYLKKTGEIYRNGTVVVKNTTTIAINDAAALQRQNNGIEHRIWLPNNRCVFPPFEDMAGQPLTNRLTIPVFYWHLIRRNERRLDTNLTLAGITQTDREIAFVLVFPFNLKNHDELTYQYIWSMPRLFAPYEDDLRPDEYCELAMRTNHGKIGTAVFRLKFEREGRLGHAVPLFSKDPFVLYTMSSTEESLAGESTPLHRTEDESYWEIFEERQQDLNGAIILRWRPSSQAAVQHALDSAPLRRAPQLAITVTPQDEAQADRKTARRS
jgi:hypothetical protein